MKRLLAIFLSACLLAGCAALPGLPGTSGTAPSATLPPAPTAAPQTLTVYAGDGTLPALQAYADAQGVTLTRTDDPASADLAVLPALPAQEGAYRDLTGDDLLAAAAARAGVDGPCTALPLGRTLYAYWADSDLLTALLGEEGAAALPGAGWEEWKALAETLTEWLADPAETAVTLNGADYTLPAERPAACEGVGGVFAPCADAAPGYTAALLAAGEEQNADTLTGPLNGVYSAVALEWDNLAPAGTRALFTRGRLTDVLALQEADAALTPLPFKCELVEGDLTSGEYNLPGLLNYPVLTAAGYLAVPAGADEAGVKAAAGAILWLYGSGEGERALAQTLCLVTPWDTASDATAPGAMQIAQVGSGILPGAALDAAAAQALQAAESALQNGEKRGGAERKAFVADTLAALGVPAAE